jgi:hypothetical protein
VEDDSRQHRYANRDRDCHQQTCFDDKGFFVAEHGKAMPFRALGSEYKKARRPKLTGFLEYLRVQGTGGGGGGSDGPPPAAMLVSRSRFVKTGFS